MEELSLLMYRLGFQTVGSTQLSRLLRNVKCQSKTAFRDATVEGMSLMVKLYKLFEQLQIQNVFKFVHVVLTDGEDNASQINLNDYLLLQKEIDGLLSGILKTFYIGVDVENNQKVIQEMAAILRCSKNNAQYYSINSNGIGDIFNKISMEIGLRIQQQKIVIQNNQGTVGLIREQVQPVLNMKINHYIVLFTLDISGSMQSNWGSVCGAVDGFLQNLGKEDFVMGITFNDQVYVLTTPQQQSNRPQLTSNQSKIPQPLEQNDIEKEKGYCCSIM